MPVYLHELVSYLSESYETGKRIQFKFDLEPLELDISFAVPLGLILNETITNALKYAFPDKKEGIIKISVKSTTPHHCTFIVSDNGIGLPEDFELHKANSLGMKLMKGLSDDIAASLRIERHKGTEIFIAFSTDTSPDNLRKNTSQSIF
jgi:two-component sensor histidine kinase